VTAITAVGEDKGANTIAHLVGTPLEGNMKNLSLSAFSTIPHPHRKHIGFLLITCAGMVAGKAHVGYLTVPAGPKPTTHWSAPAVGTPGRQHEEAPVV
jgi:hypothetical protein